MLAAITNLYKLTKYQKNNATFGNQSLVAGLWANTAAITSISVGGYSGNLAQYSSASLYGIKNT